MERKSSCYHEMFCTLIVDGRSHSENQATRFRKLSGNQGIILKRRKFANTHKQAKLSNQRQRDLVRQVTNKPVVNELNQSCFVAVGEAFVGRPLVQHKD